MPWATRPAPAAIRAARRWLRRLSHMLWRVVRVVLVASAAMGPNLPPPPPPPPAQIEMRADDGDPGDVSR
jgi:hypothetical protein